MLLGGLLCFHPPACTYEALGGSMPCMAYSLSIMPSPSRLLCGKQAAFAALMPALLPPSQQPSLQLLQQL